MTAVFEFLFKYRPLLYSKGTLALRPAWPWYVTVLLALAAIAAAYLLYRWTPSTLPWRLKFLLSGLRAFALLILLLIFLQPVLILRSAVPQQSFVAIAYDTSKSMEIRDQSDGKSRLEAAKHLLRPEGNKFLDDLEKKFKLRIFRFSGAAERVAAFEDIPRHGNVTNLAESLDQIVSELGTAPVSGVVLITDGADNRSKNLDAEAAILRGRNIPVYPIGIGASAFSRDTEVGRVTAPRSVLKNALIEADVSIVATGYAGRRAKLLVNDGDKTIKSQDIQLGNDGEAKNFKIHFSSEAAGPRLFTFRVQPFPEEVVSENNDQTVLIRIEDQQPQVLYTEGEPRWMYSFLRRAVQEDKNLRLVTLLRQAQGKFLRQGIDSPATLEQGFPTDKAELFRYKALILGSVEASFFTFDQLRMISDFVSQRGGGFLMLGGKNSFGQGGYINTPIEDMLPVIMRSGTGGQGSPEFQNLEYKVKLTNYGTDQPVTRISVSEEDNRKRWESVPSLVGWNPTAGTKPGATVLFQRFGRGKSMALTTASTWRWKMELESTDKFHDQFWKQMLRWLVSDVPDPVQLLPENHSYSLEEPVAMHAEVNDPAFLRLNNVQASVKVKSPSGEETALQMTWDVDKDGQYTATFLPREEGVHEATVEAFQNRKSLGTGKASFSIADSTEEYHNSALNSDLLKRLASGTGGRYYTLQDVQNVPEDISYVDGGTSRLEEKELWDMPLLFIMLIGAISAEWIIRKRKGLA